MLSSTATSMRCLSQKEFNLIASNKESNFIASIQSQAPLINFTLDSDAKSDKEKLKEKLQQLNPRIAGKFILQEGLVSLQDLEREFKTLCEIHGDITDFSWSENRKNQVEEERKQNIALLSEQDKITIEEYKLVIIRTMLFHLKRSCNSQDPKIQMQPAPVSQPSKWRTALYAFLMLCNILFMAIGGFLGMQEMLTGIFNGISPIALYLASGILTGLECILWYSIIFPFLKKGLGLSETTIDKTIMATYDEQLQATVDINRMLVSEPQFYTKMNVSDYINNTRLAKLFNDHIASIKVKEFQESTFKKGLRLFLSGVNTLLTITNGYFMASMLLKAVAATLLGTPAGWAIIIGIIVIQIINSYVIRSQSVYEMLNTNASQIKITNEKINSFEKCNSKFDRILSNKKAAIPTLNPEDEISSAAHNLHFMRDYQRIRNHKTPMHPAPQCYSSAKNEALDKETETKDCALPTSFAA